MRGPRGAEVTDSNPMGDGGLTAERDAAGHASQ